MGGGGGEEEGLDNIFRHIYVDSIRHALNCKKVDTFSGNLNGAKLGCTHVFWQQIYLSDHIVNLTRKNKRFYTYSTALTSYI